MTEHSLQTTLSARLAGLGLTLPPAPAPAANYVPTRLWGGVLYVSGQLPIADGKPQVLGLLGRDLGVADGQAAARLCALNLLAQAVAAAEAAGQPNATLHCLKLTGFVAATPDFRDHPAVVNGASDLMALVLGEPGRHARAAIGVASLPFGVAVEVEAVMALE